MSHLLFNEDYLRCNEFTVSMIVTNGVLGDSRVLKTADSLNKRGYRVHLFGLNKKPQQEELEGFPFRITLVANPAKKMKEEGIYYISKGKQNLKLFYERLSLSYLEAFNQKKYDFLHTHDMWGLSIGYKLLEWGVIGGKGWIHDIHEYTLGCTNIPEVKLSFHLAMENRYIYEPDVLTCASPEMSRLLADDYKIDPPQVVLNTPRRADFDPFYPKPIRHVLSIKDDIPLMVYSGNVKPARGVDLAVEALPLLSEVHLALITNDKGPYLKKLMEMAKQLGVSSYLHILPYVPVSDVTSFLFGATVGINTIIQYGNSDITLPTKPFEYLHAGLPLVHTANSSISELITKHNCGFTYPSGDVEGFVVAIKKVLKKFPKGLPNVVQGSKLAKQFCWEKQEKIIFTIYDNLLSDHQSLKLTPASKIQPILHLPRYSANQPGTFARAFKALGYDARSAAHGKNKFEYNEDIKITKQKNALSSINDYFKIQGLDKYKTYHFHAAPLLYDKNIKFPTGADLVLLKDLGKRVYFHYRGSETRLHSIFKKTSPYNYVNDFKDELNNYRQKVEGLPYRFNEQDQREFCKFVQGVCDGTFVTDPELQCYVPGALIVPRAIDINGITNFEINKKQAAPLIVHAPSRRLVKGTDNVIAAVEQLKKEGYVFDFTIVESMPHKEVMKAFSRATIIVDQLRIGWYGVLSVEGMAMGKAVVSYVSGHLRHYLPIPPPLVYANPDNITEVLRYLLENPKEVVSYGKRGRKFVEKYHDAGAIAETLINVYRRPVRPADSVAVDKFIEYQKSKEKTKKKPVKKMAKKAKRSKGKNWWRKRK